MTKEPCEALSHQWKYLWDGMVRRCQKKKCGTTHYFHICYNRWEEEPNSAYYRFGLGDYSARVQRLKGQGVPVSGLFGYMPAGNEAFDQSGRPDVTGRNQEYDPGDV